MTDIQPAINELTERQRKLDLDGVEVVAGGISPPYAQSIRSSRSLPQQRWRGEMSDEKIPLWFLVAVSVVLWIGLFIIFSSVASS